jgi:hypothetical protein
MFPTRCPVAKLLVPVVASACDRKSCPTLSFCAIRGSRSSASTLISGSARTGWDPIICSIAEYSCKRESNMQPWLVRHSDRTMVRTENSKLKSYSFARTCHGLCGKGAIDPHAAARSAIDPPPAQHRPADRTASAGPAPDPQPVPPRPHRLLLPGPRSQPCSCRGRARRGDAPSCRWGRPPGFRHVFAAPSTCGSRIMSVSFQSGLTSAGQG